ncbi:MAG: hypothetical protein LIO69_00260 [Oscillospiraceae bacterium]|nr:hypothetical protein [Oscillospiraceae bacterium]
MDLKQYYKKKVKIINSKGAQYIGTVIGFSFAKDDEKNEDAIDLDCGYGFYTSDIKSIEILSE